MVIGDRLRVLREAKNLSQGDIEKRAGLLRCYISRVENGHTVPALNTIEKFARALEVPIYHLLYEGEKPPAHPRQPEIGNAKDLVWGTSKKEARLLAKLQRLLSRVNERDRGLLLFLAERMAWLKQARSRKRPHGVGGTV